MLDGPERRRRPPDEAHPLRLREGGVLLDGFEGALILIAAGTIAFAAGERLLPPQPIKSAGIGLTISVLASLVNLGVARVLLGAERTSTARSPWKRTPTT